MAQPQTTNEATTKTAAPMTVKTANAMLKLASSDDSRPVLRGVHVEHGYTVVTDTHRMYINGKVSDLQKLEPGSYGQGTTYSRESVEREIAMAKIEKRDVNLSNCEPTEAVYPNWKRVVPSEHSHQIAFNAKYLKEICDLALKSGAQANRITVRMTTFSRPATIEWLDDREDCHTAILMPMAIQD